MRILLLEDHDALRRMVADHLAQRGFAVDALAYGREAIKAANATGYDAMILDLGLPDMDGMEVLARIRECTKGHLAALILTARDSVAHRVLGLNAGADDYLVKPFDLIELEARLRALLRRPGLRADTMLTFGRLSLNANTRVVEVAGAPLELARREIDCLEALLRTPGRVAVKDVLEEHLYSHDEPVTPNAVEAVISRLRKKLAQVDADVRIETRRGIGYRLCLESPP